MPFYPGQEGNKKVDQGQDLRTDWGIWNLRHSESRSMCDSLIGPKAVYTEKEPEPLKENAFSLSNMAASGGDPEYRYQSDGLKR